ncbi:MAG TPA: cation:proton antiporter [Bacteroidia bacterium]|nr:cation:proton antiporter [Bacteroidia bacterium]
MKKALSYILLIALFTALTWLVIHFGEQIPGKPAAHLDTGTTLGFADKARPVLINSPQNLLEQFLGNIKYPISILLLQVIVILLLSRFFGSLFRLLGQQSVIGEIIAGIFLGPSILGWLWPELSHFLFPQSSFLSLQFLSQIGLAFFMFVIGMDLDLSKIRDKTHDAVIISHVSIIFPFFLGSVLSYFIYTDMAPAGIAFMPFALFMGIAMSITAFPVLARIIRERGMAKSPLGVLAITCAAADDVTAWCLLAAVIAIVKAGSITSSLFTISLAILYILTMLFFVKPLLQKLADKKISEGNPGKTFIGMSFFILLLSAYFTEIIGIHALFGSFIAGVIMPNTVRFKEILTEKVEDLSTILLLPIFFAFTGLRTQIGLLSQGHLWGICGIVVLVAIGGKLLGSTVTAKLIGRSWKDALSIGVLMNTRGLMELVVLNIGYDLGILGPEIFAIMVVMALLTTFMTGPLLDLIEKLFHKDIKLEAKELRHSA